MHRRAYLLALAARAVDDPVRPDIQRPFAFAALVMQDRQPLPQRLLGHEQRGFLFAYLERQGDDFRGANHVNRRRSVMYCAAAQPARAVARATGRWRPAGRSSGSHRCGNPAPAPQQ